MANTEASSQKTNLWLWALLIVTLLLTVYVNLQSDDVVEEVELSKPTRRTSLGNNKPRPIKSRSRSQANLISVPDDLINLDLLERDQALQSVGNAFVSRSWYVPPPPPQVMEEEYEPEAPKAPPVPFKYIGRFDEYQIYLQEGDKLYTVEVGDTIKGVWRIESDEPNRIELTYIPLNELKILNKN